MQGAPVRPALVVLLPQTERSQSQGLLQQHEAPPELCKELSAYPSPPPLLPPPLPPPPLPPPPFPSPPPLPPLILLPSSSSFLHTGGLSRSRIPEEPRRPAVATRSAAPPKQDGKPPQLEQDACAPALVCEPRADEGMPQPTKE